MLTHFVASKTVDSTIDGIEGIHRKNYHFRQERGDQTGNNSKPPPGVTVYKGRGGLSNAEQDILFWWNLL